MNQRMKIIKAASYTLVICITLSLLLHPAILICHALNCPIETKLLLSIIKDYKYSLFYCSFLIILLLGIYFKYYIKNK